MEIEKVVAAWGLGKLQEFVQFSHRLEQCNKTLDDVIKYIEDSKKRAKREAIIFKAVLQGIECPGCKGPMTLFPVNTGAADRIEDQSIHSQWWCNKCDISYFNKETYNEEAERVASILEVHYERKKRKAQQWRHLK